MAVKKQERFTTPKGRMVYPKVNNVIDMYDGKPIGYSVQMVFNEEDTKRMIELLERKLEEAKASEEYSGKKWSAEPSMGYRIDENTGDTMFKFHTKHEYKDKNGNLVKKIVPIYDASNVQMDDVSLGNGTIGKVSFTPAAFYLSSKNNGITLYLNALQIIDLVEYGGSKDGSSFGFGSEDGYTHKPTTSNGDFGDEDEPF